MNLTNNFHNTSVTIRKTAIELERMRADKFYGRLSKSDRAYLRRVWRSLCGVTGCTCGDDFGRRGPQPQ